MALLTAPFTHLVGAVIDGGAWWWLLVLLDGPMLVAWWCATPALVRGRALAERDILGYGRVEQLERRVEEVAASRSETLDHSAAEVRRIERDLHDGAQARIAAVGMNVGLAEKLITSDPAAAAELLREARETAVSALEDLRSVVRGIHPPVLADRGLAGAIEALALPIPLPVTVSARPAGHAARARRVGGLLRGRRVPGQHRQARRRQLGPGSPRPTTATVLRLVVGDDGRGGADPAGSGLAGVAAQARGLRRHNDRRQPGGRADRRDPGGAVPERPEPDSGPSSPRTRPSSGSA